jgi:hypothetical protein
MSEGGTPPFHQDFSASAKSPLKRLISRNSAAENRHALFLELPLLSRNSATENRRALFLELLWTGRIPVL